MTKSQLFAASAAIVLAASLFVGIAATQVPNGSPAVRPGPVGPIGLLDVQRVFENHARFKQMMDGLDQDISRIDTWIKTERDGLRRMNDELKTFKPGSPEYKQKEQQITEKVSWLQGQVQLQQKEVLQKKAKIHSIVFREVRDEAATIAVARGLIAVMQFNSKPVDSEDPEDIIRELNSLMVYHAPGIDITQEVLDNLARRGQYGAAATGSTNNGMGIPMQGPRR